MRPAFYGPDLAHIHDAGFGEVARAGGAALVRELRHAGIRRGTVADLECGSGIASRVLVDSGHDVVGFDLSAEPARDRPGAGARGDLRGGGGLHRRAGARAPREPRRAWQEGDGWLVAVEATEDRDRATLRRRITSFRRDGRTWRRSDEEHLLCLLPRERVLADLADAGFTARALAGYGRAVRFRRGHIGIAAAGAGRPRLEMPRARTAARRPSRPAPMKASS
jgi:hypothetical protein